MHWSGLCLVANLLAARPAFGESRRTNDLLPQPRRTCEDGDGVRHRKRIPNECTPSTLRRSGAVLAALTVGLAVHGTGSYLVGRKKTAKRLALIEAIGLGGMLAGGGPIGLSGGYPPTMTLTPVLLVGAGMFATSWWADIAVAAGISPTGQARTAAPWSLELAMLYLSDPYRQAGLGRLGGDVALGRLTLGASLTSDAENEIRTGELDARVRIFGAAPTGDVVDDGSRLIARAGLRGHQDDGDRVKLATGEIEVIGRLDLFRVDPALRGSFVQMSTGLGVERAYYTGDRDNTSLLLGTFGWGLYLGNRGEVQLFYDHRRESMVGGIAAGRAAGFVGSMNASLDWMFDRHWATHLEVNVGTAWLTTFGLRYRGGVPKLSTPTGDR